MTRYLLAALIALAATPSQAGGLIETGADLLRACKPYAENRYSAGMELFDQGECAGILIGAAYYVERHAGRECIPRSATIKQIALVVVQHLERSPQTMHEGPILLIARALHAAWPCPGASQ